MPRQYTFKSEHGKVKYNLTMLPGCCGIALVYNVDFIINNNEEYWNKTKIIKHRKLLFKQFNKFLTRSTKPFDLNRCKIIISDSTNRAPDDSDLYTPVDFCTYMKWKKIGTRRYNPKSGNHIQLWEKNRTVKHDDFFDAWRI